MGEHVAGKSIVITGAGSGFGRLTASRLGALGARITCIDIDGDAAGQTAQAIRDAGGTAHAVKADVTSIEDMHGAARDAVQKYGAIDVMVNNAGTMPLAFIADHATALPAWNRCIDINLKGTLHGCVAVHDQMVAQGRGHIINISSIYGNRPAAGAAVYGATKAAIDYFTHALRQEARGKIKVTVIKPTGVMNTGLAGTVVNQAAGVGLMGNNVAAFYADFQKAMSGEGGSVIDPDSMDYAFLDPEPIADAIVHVIDQPWGVSISDVTVRASAEYYIN